MDQHLQQDVLPAFEVAQRATLDLMRELIARLEVGMRPADIAHLARALATQRGFTGWFHPPEIYFDPTDTRLRLPHRRRLEPGTIVRIDLAPTTEAAFGDLGYSFAFRAAPEPRLIAEARDVCRATCGFASRWKCVGELFVFAQSWANNRRLTLAASRSIGHACFPRQGLAGAAWPRAARMSILLRRNQIQWFNPRRMAGVYAVNPPISLNGAVAAFEEMIFINGETRLVVGRNSFDEIGRL